MMTMQTTGEKTYTKRFEHKGQMISYYNKVRQNLQIEFCSCGWVAGQGWTVMCSYRKAQ